MAGARVGPAASKDVAGVSRREPMVAPPRENSGERWMDSENVLNSWQKDQLFNK